MAHSNKSNQARELKDGTMLIFMFFPAYCCFVPFPLGLWLVVCPMLVSQFSNLYLTPDTSTKWVSPQSYTQPAVTSSEAYLLHYKQIRGWRLYTAGRGLVRLAKLLATWLGVGLHCTLSEIFKYYPYEVADWEKLPMGGRLVGIACRAAKWPDKID